MSTLVDVGENAQILKNAYSVLSAQPCVDGQGSIYVFTSPLSGAGTSYVARNMALIAAQQASDQDQVLLLDMDIQKNSQSAYFFTPSAQELIGTPQGPYDATFGTVPFWRVTPSMVNEQGQNVTDSHFMSLYILQRQRLAFNHFHWERFKAGQNAHVQNSRPYWQALRNRFSAIFVDTPALDRADIVSSVCTDADANVLVCNSANAKSETLARAAQYLKDHSAQCAGVILNDVPTAPAMIGGTL